MLTECLDGIVDSNACAHAARHSHFAFGSFKRDDALCVALMPGDAVKLNVHDNNNFFLNDRPNQFDRAPVKTQPRSLSRQT